MVGSKEDVRNKRRSEDAVPTGIRNADSEQFIEHVADDFDRVTARLVADRISHKQLATRQRTRSSYVCVVVLEVRQRRASHKLVQHVSYTALRNDFNHCVHSSYH